MKDVVDSRTQHMSDIHFLSFGLLLRWLFFFSFLVFFAPRVSRICLSINLFFFWFV